MFGMLKKIEHPTLVVRYGSTRLCQIENRESLVGDSNCNLSLKGRGMSLWGKVVEVHRKLLARHSGEVDKHLYRSSPLEWLLADTTVLYWKNPETQVVSCVNNDPILRYLFVKIFKNR